MAITRKMLKAMGIDEDKIEQILEAHTDTVDGLKAEAERLRADAGKLAGVTEELEQARKTIAEGNKESYKVKYEALKEDFDKYKGEQSAREAKAAKESAYRGLLKDVGISEKRIGSVLKVSDLDGIELDDKGAIKNAAALKKAAAEEWGDFIAKTEVHGVDVDHPASNGGSKTKDEIMNIKDAGERQAAMAENHELFGF